MIEEYGNNRLNNLVIESDNLPVLRRLLETAPGSIDVIAIDPPYNTEIDYVGYRDSGFEDGWGAFMEERLALARGLLSPTGVMFVNIDQNELVTLLDICYRLFGKENVSLLVWPKVDSAFDANRVEKPIRNVRSVHEYIVLCYADRANTCFKDTCDGRPLESIVSGYGTTSSAKDEIRELLGSREAFSTPKPVRLLMELIRVSSKSDSTVLDFFAGSGTTGHAVLNLNREDGGNRRFILVTNDESGICREVTVPRLSRAMGTNVRNEGFSFCYGGPDSLR